METEQNIYADERFRDLDIGKIMRVGHPDIDEGDEHIVAQIVALRRRLGRPLRVLDVGAGSGHLSLLLAQALPDSAVVANEIAAIPAAQARAKLAPFPHARVCEEPFETWTETVDVVISWGSHHHLSHDYLAHARRLLSPEGILIVGDELCPEYLSAADQERLRAAERIEIVDGYIFDNEADLTAYRERGVVPDWSVQLEELRRRALWSWYKFVGDFAIANNSWDVLIAELQIARDDLITSFAGEHKTSPCLLERELVLSGFGLLERTPIGKRKPSLQSCVIYTCRAERA